MQDTRRNFGHRLHQHNFIKLFVRLIGAPELALFSDGAGRASL
jgi:hypothetical protein